MKVQVAAIYGLSAFLAAGLLAACSHHEAAAAGAWNPKAAAAYLDRRTEWWMGWEGAARDHETFCISCHTALPYALARAALRSSSDAGPSEIERRLVDNVATRVRLWREVEPYYTKDGDKIAESRGTEAVLNALILSLHDARRERLSEETRNAFDHMWALQQTQGDRAGAWAWLQFGLKPWEASDSPYYGAALAAVAVGAAPQHYARTPALQGRLTLLREYLHREYSKQSLANRLVVLWASAEWPALLSREQRRALVEEALGDQRGDGGWSLFSLASTGNASRVRVSVRSWIRPDEPADHGSDGYATGLVVFVLLEAGTPGSDARIQKGLSWLRRNQDDAEGAWRAYSLNKRRDPSSNIGRFMSDAATAYAVLALTRAGE